MHFHKLQKTPLIISITLLLLAIPEGWPYGYYTLLRFTVCGTSVYMALFSIEHQKKILDLYNWLCSFIIQSFNTYSSE